MSKYKPIQNFLRDQQGPLEVSFSSLADLIDGGLPDSAYRYEAWWATDATHVQSRAWVAAGYRAQPDLSKCTVRFVPN